MRLEWLGLALILAGFAVALAAALALAVSAARGEVGAGGCIVILFFPICFGIGPLAPYLLIVAAALALALTALSFLLWRWVAAEARRALQGSASSSR